MDRLPARPVAEFDPVRLAAVAPAERLVAEDQASSTVEAGRGQEEPLALAAVGGVLAAVAGLGPEPLASLGAWTSAGLSASFACRTVPTGADSGTAATNQCRSSWPQRNLCFSPPSRTIRSRCRSAGRTSRTATSGSVPRARDLEELAFAVGLDVQRDDARRDSGTAGRPVGDLDPGPDPGELREQIHGVHRRASLERETRADRGGFTDKSVDLGV